MKVIQATKGFSFIVDDEDFDKVNDFLWYSKNSKTLSFFSEVSGANLEKIKANFKWLSKELASVKKYKLTPDQLIVEYDKSTHFISFVNHNRNDFRRENLRVIPNRYVKLHRASPSTNKSMYRGVSPKRDKFTASLLYTNEDNEKTKVIRHGFLTEEAAALAYNELAEEYYGEYAYLNIIGKDSRKPSYTTIEESDSKRSKRTSNSEKGFTEYMGRYTVRVNKTSIAQVEDKDVAAFYYNLASKMFYGDQADLNLLSPDTHEGERIFFHTPFTFEGTTYPTLWDACQAHNKDAVTLYRLMVRGIEPLEAFTKAPNYTNEKHIRFNFNKYLHECWVDDVFEGYYATLADTMYAYNQIVGKSIYELPEGYIGQPMVVGKHATILYKNKKYPSLNSLAKDLGMPTLLVWGHFDNFEIDDIIEAHENNHRLQTLFTVEGKKFFTIEQFLRFSGMTRYRINKIKNILSKTSESYTMQDVYDYYLKNNKKRKK